MSYRLLALNWRCLRHPEAGGAELNIMEQARRWAAAGHHVTLVCADPGREHAPQRDEVVDGVMIKRMGGRFTLYLWAALFLLRHGWFFDYIVDVSNGVPFFSPLFTRTPSVLLIHHVHGQQWFSEFPRLFAWFGSLLEAQIVPWVYRRRAVIAVSPTTRDALLPLGFDPARLHVVYNGVDLPDMPAPPTSTHHVHIAYIGRLKRYKRLDLLLHALDALRRDLPQIQLDIAGDGDARADIEALIDHLDLGAHVTLHGRVSEDAKAAILRSATVFATPSMHEGWGLSVIEANAWGCPAVAYDVPGLRVAIRQGETGLLADDDAAFRDALASIVTRPDLRAQLATGARAWAATFSWDGCAAATLAVLEASDKRRPAYGGSHIRTRSLKTDA